MARIFPLVLLILGLVPARSPAAPDSFKFGRFGAVPVVHPQGEPSRVAILFSGEHGIGARETAMAAALAASGALVFEVDTQRYFAAPKGKGQHLFPAVEFEAMSQIGQKEMGLPEYRQPILVGTGAGAGLAYVALAEAPGGTFAGAVSDGFCAVIPSEHLFSRGSRMSWKRKWPGPGVWITPNAGLESPWLILEPAGKTECLAGPASEFAKSIGSAQVIPPPAGASPQEAWKQQLAAALRILAEKHRQEEAAQAARGELRDLPINEVGAVGPEKDALAVIVTGSGGYVGLDQRLGHQLAAHGVPVVGLSSLAYFWKPRNPDGVSRDLARILEHYLAAWHKSRAIVVGYSQGADVAPFMVDRLPATLRAKIGLVALIGPDGGAQFDMHPDGWISNRPDSPEIPVAPEIPKLKGKRVLCIYGAEEKESLCRGLASGLAALVEVAGSHDFSGDAAQLTERFLFEVGLGPAPPKPAPAKPRPAQGSKAGKGAGL